VTTARTLCFTENILDEEMEAGDTSGFSLQGLEPPSTLTSRPDRSPPPESQEDSENILDHTLDVASLQTPCENSVRLDGSTTPHDNGEGGEDKGDRHNGHNGFEPECDDPTVRKMPPESQPSVAAAVNTGFVHGPSSYDPVDAKIRMNSAVERIVVSVLDLQYIYLRLISYEGQNMGYCRRGHYAWTSFRHDTWQ